ncbi:hypothetical protein AXF42_Ash014499 [Apostasia shenzhenica]|uniref:Uncharacterized protein n=1 Tax=Apostasia shenzhenica TaxID=1088818 RepID=A0A2H9ZWS4_9ASPA|nr:hypothetical protein AXF42_Ash014499 [Apostasia shenzhenica]
MRGVTSTAWHNIPAGRNGEITRAAFQFAISVYRLHERRLEFRFGIIAEIQELFRRSNYVADRYHLKFLAWYIIDLDERREAKFPVYAELYFTMPTGHPWMDPAAVIPGTLRFLPFTFGNDV